MHMHHTYLVSNTKTEEKKKNVHNFPVHNFLGSLDFWDVVEVEILLKTDKSD